MKFSNDVYFVTAILTGLGFIPMTALREVTVADIGVGVELCLSLAGRPLYEQDHNVLMLALKDRGFGVEGFVVDQGFGPKAKESLRIYLAAAVHEAGG